MTKNLPAKTGTNEIDQFVSEKPVLELVDTLLYLDTIKQYVPLSHNGEVGELLQKRNIPVVHGQKDFDYFYESLRNKMEELSGSDERAKTYLKQSEYQQQMSKLPSLVSSVQSNLDALKAPFKAVMEYAWRAVVEHGLEMNEKVVKPIGQYRSLVEIVLRKDRNADERAELSIEPKSQAMNDNGEWNCARYYIVPVFKSKITEEKGLFGKVKTIKTKTSELEDIRIVDETVEEAFDNDFKNERISLDYLKIILSLPQIIDNHLKERQQRIEEILTSQPKGK